MSNKHLKSKIQQHKNNITYITGTREQMNLQDQLQKDLNKTLHLTPSFTEFGPKQLPNKRETQEEEDETPVPQDQRRNILLPHPAAPTQPTTAPKQNPTPPKKPQNYSL